MTQTNPPANWYPDPEGTGGLRYWDGAAWTQHRALPPPPQAVYGMWGQASWKGAQLGRPVLGPGALADPGRRLGARLLDVLILLPLFAIVLVVTLLIAAPHFGPIFPDLTTTNGTVSTPPPGLLWIYVTVLACVVATGLVMVVYETVATVRYGRTLGKAWLHVRPVQLDGTSLGWGRALARVVIYWLFWSLGWLGAIDPLWCLWDDTRQCLHDKVAGSIVINDPVPA